MGNIIAAGASIGVPLLTTSVVVPYIFHPHRWGGVPWKEPNFIFLGLVSFIVNVIILMMLGTLSGLMTTKKECNRTNLGRSIKRSLWIVVGYIIGNILLALFPFIKVPLLPLVIWMPYAGWLVHGFLVSIPILFCGAIANGMLRNEVCRGIR